MSARPSVLIVDDNEANLRLYRAILKDAGADLHVARSGVDALAECERRRHALILLDVHLDGMSGFEVARRLRERAGAAVSPIVFVSAVYTHEADAFRGYALGAVDYMLSPVVPEVLRGKVDVFVRLERLHHEAQAQSVAIEQAYRELRVAHAELEHFSYSASHDLRTPLAQIASFAELLRLHAGERLLPREIEFVDHIAGTAQRMSRLIEDLLLLARTARAEVHAEPVDLSAMARDVVGELTRLEPSRGVRWSVQDDLRVLGDPGLLRTVLDNLLSNAWKYSAQRAEPVIEVGRREDPGGGDPAYFVHDNGAGFDLAAAGERLFEPFQRFHADTQFQGTGVGLAIVQRVVQKHGGRVWAESAPGAGARFFFTLPGAANGAQGADREQAA